MSHRHKHADPTGDLLGLPDTIEELVGLFQVTESRFEYSKALYKQHNAERRLVVEALRIKREELKGVRVTDHAVVRYLERVEGMDMAGLKAKMLDGIPMSDEFTRMFPAGPDHRYIVAGNLIVTVRPNKPLTESEEQESA